MKKKTPEKTATKKPLAVTKAASKQITTDPLLRDLRQIIAQARESLAQTVNATLVMLHWQIGRRIREDILQERRAEYGQEIVATVATKLAQEFGRGFSEKSLRRMLQFAEIFPDEQIVASLMRQLSWTHFLEILPLKDQLQREFYAEMCRLERWSVRTLRKKIGGLLYERTALAKKPKKLIEQELQTLRTEDQLTPDMVFRDPYFLNFLGLQDGYKEKDLEAAILRDVEKFLLELGDGFTFVARQNASPLTAKITISTCCCFIANCVVWWRLNYYVADHITNLVWRS